MSAAEAAILRWLEVREPLLISGVVECKAALVLQEQGLIDVWGNVTEQGGAGLVTRRRPPHED